jgi:hypothetical protein
MPSRILAGGCGLVCGRQEFERLLVKLRLPIDVPDHKHGRWAGSGHNARLHSTWIKTAGYTRLGVRTASRYAARIGVDGEATPLIRSCSDKDSVLV